MKTSIARAFAAIFLVLASFGAGAAPGLPGFDELERELNIRPEQKEQYDMAVAATKRALLAVGIAAIQVKQRLAEELMKPRPDLRSLANAHEEIVDQTRPLFKIAGEEWKKLYEILDDDQVAVAKSFLRKHLNRLLAT